MLAPSLLSRPGSSTAERVARIPIQLLMMAYGVGSYVAQRGDPVVGLVVGQRRVGAFVGLLRVEPIVVEQCVGVPAVPRAIESIMGQPRVGGSAVRQGGASTGFVGTAIRQASLLCVCLLDVTLPCTQSLYCLLFIC